MLVLYVMLRLYLGFSVGLGLDLLLCLGSFDFGLWVWGWIWGLCSGSLVVFRVGFGFSLGFDLRLGFWLRVYMELDLIHCLGLFSVYDLSLGWLLGLNVDLED